MEDTMLELLEVCRQKEFYCMHNDVDDLIKSALNSKLLLINLRSQRLDKKKQEVKNVVKQLTKRGTRIAKSLQNFRVKKSFTSLNNTSQISVVHAITHVLPTKEPEYSLSMGHKHLSIIPETKSDEVIKSSAKNLLPILSTDDLLPPNIESDDYDLERDIHFLKDLLVNDSILIPENKSSNFDHHDDPLFPRPPPEPPDVEFFFDFEPNLGEVISAVMNNIDELNEDESFEARGVIDVFANVEDDD
nr:hypothetical protein [Tanacetum cinerariifolium]